MRNESRKKTVLKVLGMHLLFVVYSVSTVISKKIGDTEPFSREFIFGYFLIFLCLGLYALGWQQVLKSFSLSSAFANKSVVVIWGMIWGYTLFAERITWPRIMGAVLIIAGVLLFASDERNAERREKQS